MKSRHRGVDRTKASRPGLSVYQTAFVFGLSAILWFAALAKGAHDLWAVMAVGECIFLATLVYLTASLQNNRPISLPLIFNFLLVFFVLLVTSRFSYDANTTRLELWILFYSGLLFYLFFNMFRDPSMRFYFLGIAGMAILPVALVALGQYIETPTHLLFSHGSVRATFTNSAVLAGFSLSWMIIFWHFRRDNPAFYVLFGASLVTLVLARSWWSGIALLIGFMYYYRDHLKEVIFSNRIKILIPVSGVLTFLFLTAYLKFGLSPESFQTLTDRWNWWRAGFHMAQEHPLTGVGLGAYAAAFPYFKPHPMLNTLYPHSSALEVLSETGLFGMVSVLLLMTAYVRLWTRQKPLAREFAAYQAALIAIVIFSLGTIYLEYFIGKMTLLMIMALVLCSAPAPDLKLSKRTFALATMALLGLSPSVYRVWAASRSYVAGIQYEAHGLDPQAVESFKEAVMLDPTQDESYAALRRASLRRYKQSRSLLDWAESLLCAQESTAWKKHKSQTHEFPPA